MASHLHGKRSKGGTDEQLGLPVVYRWVEEDSTSVRVKKLVPEAILNEQSAGFTS